MFGIGILELLILVGILGVGVVFVGVLCWVVFLANRGDADGKK